MLNVVLAGILYCLFILHATLAIANQTIRDPLSAAFESITCGASALELSREIEALDPEWETITGGIAISRDGVISTWIWTNPNFKEDGILPPWSYLKIEIKNHRSNKFIDGEIYEAVYSYQGHDPTRLVTITKCSSDAE